MNLEELRDVRRTERQRDGLQHLRESFYRDVATYLADLKAERERAAEAADDPFSDPEVRQLTDEEQDLFDDLVARIERNREHVLDSIDPDAAESSGSDGADRETRADDTAAGDPQVDTPDPNDLLSEAMGGTDAAAPSTADPEAADPTEGGGTPTADGGAPRNPSPDSTASAPPSEGPSAAPAPTPGGGSAPESADAPSGSRDEDGGPASATGGDADDGDGPDRTTVYVTRDVGEIYGVDERTYSLDAEDVVDLPADNAEALVARDAAEPLE